MPTSHAAATTHFPGQILPWCAGLETKHE
jgi:hypothetical protein